MSHYCSGARRGSATSAANHMLSPVLQECSISLPRPLHPPMPPEKRIGIQIRKVYKTDDETAVVNPSAPGDESTKPVSGLSSARNAVSPLKLKTVVAGTTSGGSVVKKSLTYVSPSRDISNDVGSASSSATSPQWVEYPESRGPVALRDIDAVIKIMCDETKSFCRLCYKTFKTSSHTRRHAAVHLNWTRFMCLACGLRTFDEYKAARHVIGSHHNCVEDVKQLNKGGHNLHKAHSCIEDAKNIYREGHYLNKPFLADLSLGETGNRFSNLMSMKLDSGKAYRKIVMEVTEYLQRICPDSLRISETKASDSSFSSIPDSDPLRLSAATSSSSVNSSYELGASTIVEHVMKAPQKLTLKLKRVHLDSVPIKLYPDDTKQLLSKAKSKSLESIIKTITIRSKSPRKLESSTTTEQPEREGCPATDDSHADHSSTGHQSSGSRMRRVIRPPAKRRYPDFPPTFTGSVKRQAGVDSANPDKPTKILLKNIKKTFNDPACPNDKKRMETIKKSETMSSGNKLKINISSLTKKPDNGTRGSPSNKSARAGLQRNVSGPERLSL